MFEKSSSSDDSISVQETGVPSTSAETVIETLTQGRKAQRESSTYADRMVGLDNPTVWHEFSPLASQYNAINLGQGFPDWQPPPFVIDAIHTATTTRRANQYARSEAHMPLATVLAQEYSQRWDIEIDAATMVGTATGCTNALYCTLQGMVGPGDEVLLLEPSFDIYSAQVKMAGGTPVYCPLRLTPIVDHSSTLVNSDGVESKEHRDSPAQFTLDMHELESKLTPRTKILLLNTPHNPTGKMFTRDELLQIATILERYPHVTILSDEVYEHIVFDQEHISPAQIMFEKTLTLSSSGKTFSCTGWKVGWVVGPPHLVKAMTAVQQWCNFSVATPNQDAIALSLLQARIEPFQGHDNYYVYLVREYTRKRQLLMDALSKAGMTPIVPPGGFFIMADTSNIDFPYNAHETTSAMPCHPMPRDWALARWMTQNVGVTAIPPSAFYNSKSTIPLASNLLRFAFCKGDDTLREAHNRLESYFGTK